VVGEHEDMPCLKKGARGNVTSVSRLVLLRLSGLALQFSGLGAPLGAWRMGLGTWESLDIRFQIEFKTSIKDFRAVNLS